jgi:hypothetical protein
VPPERPDRVTDALDSSRSSFRAHGSTGRGPRRSLAALAIAAILTLGVAIVGRISSAGPPVPSVARPAVAEGPSASRAAPGAASSTPGTVAAGLPRSIVCGDIVPWRCRQLVLAGLVLLPPEEAARQAEVYPTLICGDDLDCPRSFLDAGAPAGSVVLTLAEGRTAWVNVVMTETPRRVGEAPRRFVGRLVRVFPPSA